MINPNRSSKTNFTVDRDHCTEYLILFLVFLFSTNFRLFSMESFGPWVRLNLHFTCWFKSLFEHDLCTFNFWRKRGNVFMFYCASHIFREAFLTDLRIGNNYIKTSPMFVCDFQKLFLTRFGKRPIRSRIVYGIRKPRLQDFVRINEIINNSIHYR